ncbi:MAG: hypothetical protein WCA84_12355 [Ignavibacteriaceae bacterium]
MKIFYLLIPVLPLLLIGCSSTYNVADFPSKDKFYADFNKSASDKSLKIIMNNDSTINAGNGALISNDSLLITIPVQKEEKISRDNIEELIYNSYDPNIINKIILKNGKSITSDRISILPDSSVSFFDYVSTNESLSLNNVKKISYKNHWLGLPVGLIFGPLIGYGLGISLGEAISQSSFSSASSADKATIYVISSIGFVTVSVLGWVNGWTYTYIFNP